MSTTFQVRSGSSFETEFSYADCDGFPLTTEGWKAVFQMRALSGQSRVLLETEAYTGDLPAPEGTVLTQTGEGTWALFLGKTITKHMPPTVVYELELVNLDNSEEVKTVISGVFKVTPEAVFFTE